MPHPQLQNTECPICPEGNRTLVHQRTSTSHDAAIDANCQLAHFRCSRCGYCPEPQTFNPQADPRIIPDT